MKKYRHAVAALVVRPLEVCSPKGCGTALEILLVHKPRKNDAWQLPQGGVEAGETIEEAAVRELHEEAGLKLGAHGVHASAVTYCYDFPAGFKRKWKPVNDGQKLCFVALEAPKDVRVIVDKDEIDNYTWIIPEQIPRYIKRKEYAEVIRKVFDEYMKKEGKSC